MDAFHRYRLFLGALMISFPLSFFAATYGYLFIHNDLTALLLFVVAPFLLVFHQTPLDGLNLIAFLLCQAAYLCGIVYGSIATLKWAHKSNVKSDA